MNIKRLVGAGIVATAMAASSLNAAIADQIYIDTVNNTGANDVTLDLVSGSPQSGSVTLEYRATNGDGKNGCNLTGTGKHVTFPLVVQTVSGTAPVLDKASVTFTDCTQTQTVNISATAVGTINVTLNTPTFQTNDPDVVAGSWDVSGAGFSVTVVDSTQVGMLDAPEIANAYLGDRADNSDCKAAWGTVGKPKQADWHGKLISAVAKQYQGQTFTSATKATVESAVEQSCRTGSLA